MGQKLRVKTGWVEEEGIKLPTYKNIPIEEDFIKVFRIMETMIARLNKADILLAFFLVNQMDYSGIVYNNKVIRERFIKLVSDKTNNELNYKEQTVYQSFNTLKKQGILIAYPDKSGAYFINPAFLHKGDKGERHSIFKNIEIETNEKIKDIL